MIFKFLKYICIIGNLFDKTLNIKEKKERSEETPVEEVRQPRKSVNVYLCIIWK
jgi:hypothetical protein